MRQICMCVGTVLSMAGACVHAQTLTDGDASFQMLTPTFSLSLGDATFRTDGPSSPDVQYKYAWYYRTQNNNQNSLLSLFDNPVTFTQGNKTRLTWTRTGPGVVGNERLDLEAIISIRDGASPGQARVFARVKLTSNITNTAPRTFNLFNLNDIDLPGGTPNPAPDDSLSYSAGRGTFAEPSSTNVGEVIADANVFAFDVASGSSLRSLLSGGSGNLANRVTYSGDGAVAHQWQWTLNPGESRIARVGHALNATAYESDPCAADLNRDNQVDNSDFVLFVNAYNDFLCPDLPAFCDSDLDEDGVVDNTDFVVFANQYTTFLCPW